MPKIIIQAGHSGRTTGATGAPNEQAHNIYVSDKLAERLRAKGFTVTRVTADPTPAQISGDFDLFFVVHYDADIYGSGGGFLDRPAVDGAAAKSKVILEAIESKYFAITGIVNKPQRRNANTSNYYMWSKISSATPCVLIECGVGMHKPDDYNILQNNRDLEVDGLYQGMLKAFNMEGSMSTELDTCMSDRLKFWKERDAALAVIEELEKKIAIEKDFNKRLLTNFMALANLLELPENSNPDAIFTAVKTLKEQSIPTQPPIGNPEGNLPAVISVNGELWSLNGVMIVDNKLQGNYKRN